MTGFAPCTGCILLLKCIKWKSWSICIKQATRLRDLEKWCFLSTMRLWYSSLSHHDHAHKHVLSNLSWRVDAAVNVFNLSCIKIAVKLYQLCSRWSEYLDTVSAQRTIHSPPFALTGKICLQFVERNVMFSTEKTILIQLFPDTFVMLLRGNESRCNLLFHFPFFVAPHVDTHTYLCSA